MSYYLNLQLVDPSFVIISTYLCEGVEKIFKYKYINFTLITPKSTSPWGGMGSWNLQFLVSLPYRMLRIPHIFGSDPSVLEKMLTDEEKINILGYHYMKKTLHRKLKYTFFFITQ